MAALLNPEMPQLAEYPPATSDLSVPNDTQKSQINQDQPPPELYAGSGENTTVRSPRRNMDKKSGSLRMNGSSNEVKGPSVLVERYEDRDGEHLVSIQQEWDGRKSMKRRNSVLLSGRKAGAGWEQSQCEICYGRTIYRMLTHSSVSTLHPSLYH